MRLVRPKPDPVLLDLFTESGQNVQRTAGLLRELFADYPESNGVGQAIVGPLQHLFERALNVGGFWAGVLWPMYLFL